MQFHKRKLLQRDATTVSLFSVLLAPLAAAAIGWRIPAPLNVPLGIHALILGLLVVLGLLTRKRNASLFAVRSAAIVLSTTALAFIAAAILALRSNAFYTSGAMMDGMALLLVVHLAERGLRRRCPMPQPATRLADDLTFLTGLGILGALLLIALEHRHVVGPLLLLAGLVQLLAVIVLMPGAMASVGWLAEAEHRSGSEPRMRAVSPQVHRFITALFVSGLSLMILGATAIRWPEDTLREVRLTAAIVLALTGAYQLGLASRVRRANAAWLVALAGAAASIAMALLTALASILPLGAVTALLVTWLVALAALMTAAALALWPMPHTRTLLLGWSATNTALAVLTLWGRPSTATIMYGGAAYAVAVGASQLTAAVWMRRFAEPWFAPTVQSRWSPPSPDSLRP